jgi:hypothetical protein
MTLRLAPYLEQNALWPQRGRHILAQFGEESIVVYQAYNHGIGQFAIRNGYFGSDFKYSRMSWFKPNFLWMMYRSGWGTKSNQEVTLAIHLRRTFFDEVLSQALPSTFGAALFGSEEDWKRAVARSEVRLQWDPDHGPTGAPQQRRAIQLGLRGDMLRRYGREAILEIEDISDFVAEQRQNAIPERYDQLLVPQERVYLPTNDVVAQHVQLDTLKVL